MSGPLPCWKRSSIRWVSDPDSDVVYAEKVEGRLAVRMRQQVREATTVWFWVGDRSLIAEAYVIPAPADAEPAYRQALVRNGRGFRVHFALDHEGALILRGAHPSRTGQRHRAQLPTSRDLSDGRSLVPELGWASQSARKDVVESCQHALVHKPLWKPVDMGITGAKTSKPGLPCGQQPLVDIGYVSNPRNPTELEAIDGESCSSYLRTERPRCGPTKMNARGSAGFESGCSLGACLIQRRKTSVTAEFG